jgi:hypothetical protein
VNRAEPAPHADSGTSPNRLVGAEAVRLHLTLAGGLSLSVAAFVIELIRALDGHRWSWLYVFEWPIFASFGVYVWWVLLHGHDRGRTTTSSPADGTVPDADLDAWTRYLAVMEAAEQKDPGRPI